MSGIIISVRIIKSSELQLKHSPQTQSESPTRDLRLSRRKKNTKHDGHLIYISFVARRPKYHLVGKLADLRQEEKLCHSWWFCITS
uniref:Uncharacterized protein n=1 Tax=Utricularia reniformis TaxID=192314 RepID=A0A1Y0B097_9LAMI|nr:hypothetical protein AEK19_MT0581 [Utricularia reniformis]ART30837.1 hypothetical protein AEK19_MT0581 [Utricularia reniformis]